MEEIDNNSDIKNRMKPFWTANAHFLKTAISLLLLSIMIWLGDAHSVLLQFQKIGIRTVLVCMLILCSAQLLSSMRWQWVLRAEGAKLPLRTLFSSYMIGMFMNNFMPTSIGGDAVKAYDIYRLTGNKGLSLISVFLERFTGLIALLILSWVGVSLSIHSFSGPVLWGWISINIIAVLSIVIVFHRPFAQRALKSVSALGLLRIEKVLTLGYEKLIRYKSRKAFLGMLIAVSFPIQLGTILIYQLIASSLQINLPFIFFMYTVPVITLLSMLPISLGGLGVRESTTVIILIYAGVPRDVALSMSLTYLSTIYLVSLVGGICLIVRSAARRASTHA
jgi:glycosyltransferase 2 family protein